MDKVQIFDNPTVITKRFEVSIPNQQGRVTVIRKEVIRRTYQMGCTDGLPDDFIDRRVDYEIYREVDLETRKKAIEVVEASIHPKSNYIRYP